MPHFVVFMVIAVILIFAFVLAHKAKVPAPSVWPGIEPPAPTFLKAAATHRPPRSQYRRWRNDAFPPRQCPPWAYAEWSRELMS